VTLRTDPTQDLFDRYGRLLAYVYRHGTDLGMTQIRRGWAEVYVFDTPFRRLDGYLRVESGAERTERGIFGRCA
jgi:micrococcal nuclease